MRSISRASHTAFLWFYRVCNRFFNGFFYVLVGYLFHLCGGPNLCFGRETTARKVLCILCTVGFIYYKNKKVYRTKKTIECTQERMSSNCKTQFASNIHWTNHFLDRYASSCEVVRLAKITARKDKCPSLSTFHYVLIYV